MAGWQAGLLVLVQSVLQRLHVVLPANTAANNLQTGPAIVWLLCVWVCLSCSKHHRSWQAECMAGWQAGLLVLVQSVLQRLHVVLPANTAANNLQTGPANSQSHLLTGLMFAECMVCCACMQHCNASAECVWMHVHVVQSARTEL